VSATYLVEVITFNDLRPGDRVLYQGAPVTVTAIGISAVIASLTEATYTTDDGMVGSIPKMMCPPLCRIIPDTPPALEAA
jgi:hypothetical protein